MAKKQLDVTGMINELRGQSVFFQKQPASGSLEAGESQPEKKKTKSKSDPRHHDTDGAAAIKERKNDPQPALGVRPVRPDGPVRGVRVPEKREMKRHAFDIYRDQLIQLKQLKQEAMLEGNDISMSAMVRNALDAFITKQQ